MYTNNYHGFSIVPPAFEGECQEAQSLLSIFYGPIGTDGVPSSVSIVVQRCCTTRDKYSIQSDQQFRRAGIRVDTQRDLSVSGRDAILCEYNMNVSNREMKCVSLAVIDQERVILVTASAGKADFGRLRDQYIASLEGFVLFDDEAGTIKRGRES